MTTGQVMRLRQVKAAVRWTAELAWRVHGVPTCSLCLRVELNGTWVRADDAIRQLRTYESSVPPRLRAVLCPLCEEEIVRRRIA